MNHHFRPDPYQIKEKRANGTATTPDRRFEFLTSKSLFVDPNWVKIYMIKLRSPVDPNEAQRRLAKHLGMGVRVRVLTSVHVRPSWLLEVELDDDMRWQDIIIKSTQALEDLVK